MSSCATLPTACDTTTQVKEYSKVLTRIRSATSSRGGPTRQELTSHFRQDGLNSDEIGIEYVFQHLKAAIAPLRAWYQQNKYHLRTIQAICKIQDYHHQRMNSLHIFKDQFDCNIHRPQEDSSPAS
jgi:hypothetical protein